ncbi:MAG: hypothetical protein HXS52_07450 [Theionarchaea archaeon]|nr:hypothetical protein [Theionarchaea archaeon]MBU7037752.1 hypothetical protein [Theionarchaea archaeon]
MALVITLGLLVLVILVVVAIYYLAKAIVYLAVNTIVGLIILGVLKWLGLLSGLNIGIWDVVLTAIGGVVGVLIIILLYFLGYDI